MRKQVWDLLVGASTASHGDVQTRRARAAFLFVAFLYIAWTASWIAVLALEQGLGWPVTEGQRTLYWSIMKALVWVLPALTLMRAQGPDVKVVILGDRLATSLRTGTAGGLLLGLLALGPKLAAGDPIDLTLNWPLVNAVVISPVVEELTFRGAILGNLSGRYGFWMANIVSSALFVGAHLPGWFFMGTLVEMVSRPIGGAFSIFLLSLVFGYVVHKSRSVLGGIVAHGISNLFSTM